MPRMPPHPRKIDVKKLLVSASEMPDLSPIEWDGDAWSHHTGYSGHFGYPTDNLGAAIPAIPAFRATRDEDPHTFDARRRKIRDRYIGARCPGVARNGADLNSIDRIIKAARLNFEAGESAAAIELLDLAVQENPQEPSPSLARLEILFLLRDRNAFVAAAHVFDDAFRGNGAWTEIQRLGRAIAPGDALFGAAIPERDHEHYGPWPHLPNWIQAPWDLTAEVVAADFHRAMLRLVAKPPMRAAS
jgi:hypothetical protein